jgi:hypothetical protein
MGSCDAAKALTEGQRAARSAIPEWDCATRQKLWPKANAQLGARPQPEFLCAGSFSRVGSAFAGEAVGRAASDMEFERVALVYRPLVIHSDRRWRSESEFENYPLFDST